MPSTPTSSSTIAVQGRRRGHRLCWVSCFSSPSIGPKVNDAGGPLAIISIGSYLRDPAATVVRRTLDFKDGAPSKAALDKVYDEIDFANAQRVFAEAFSGASIRALHKGLQSVMVAYTIGAFVAFNRIRRASHAIA
jgi:hypothetical protein